LNVPPLRDRAADVAPLVQQFVAQVSAKHATRPPKISRDVMGALRAYAWPGNVRELRNVIELVGLLRAGKQVRLRDLPDVLQKASQTLASDSNGDPTANDVIALKLDQRLGDMVRQILHAAVALEGGNRTRTALRLGISLRTVQRHLARG
jgi:DNA-binding NtrC family response regulator